MKHSRQIISELLNTANAKTLPRALKDYADFVNSVEKKGDSLIVYVKDPAVKYLIKRKEREILDDVDGVQYLKVFLYN